MSEFQRLESPPVNNPETSYWSFPGTDVAATPLRVQARIRGLAFARSGRVVTRDDALALFGLRGDAFAESV